MASNPEATAAPGRPDEIRAVPVRHPGRWIAAAIIILVAASVIHALIINPNAHWYVVGEYMFNSEILAGVVLTVELTIASMAVGIALGVVLAVMRSSANPVLASTSWIYVWLFRGLPVLVQILFWYFIADFFSKRVGIGVPFGPALFHVEVNRAVTPITAAILGLGLNEAAYMAEIVRAGLISVDEGQTMAAQSLGMTRGQTLRKITLPQAMRVIIPPTGNETIGMLKYTSLASVIAVRELLHTAENFYSKNFETIQLLIVASLWYLILTSILYVGQYFLERRFGRGTTRVNLGQKPGQTPAVAAA
ncbi:MAG TPA: amino acid ABC transporter permease [Solirubrobacteraceae bacterium]|nr:amino acid ABC transporter permease [Solirubrobacteraceae bacterium]